MGFLTTSQIANLRDILGDVVSSDFGKKLVKRVTDWVNQGTPLSNLTYKDSKTYNALLLFNILSDLIIKDSKVGKSKINMDLIIGSDLICCVKKGMTKNTCMQPTAENSIGIRMATVDY